MKKTESLFAKLLVIMITLTIVCNLCACNKNEDLPTNEHVVLMTATNSNIGSYSADDDYWEYSSWTVYYDGVVEYSATYNVSGVLREETFDLSEENLKILYTMLNEMEEFDDCEVTDEYGNSWYIIYFDENGNEVDSFSGDITGKSTLTDIEDINKKTH